MAYLNGRLPAAELAGIPGSGVLFPRPFIPQVVALREAFADRFGKPLHITDGYRPYDGGYYTQVETMLRRYKPADEFRRLAPGVSTAGRKYHVWQGVRRYLLPGQAQVAFPGASNHGRAEAPAVDLGSGVNVMDSTEHRWVVANAPRYGARWPAEWARAGREPWHVDFTHVVRVNTRTRIPTVNVPTPTGDLPTPLEDDDMPKPRTMQHPDGRIGLAEVSRFTIYPDMEHLRVMVSMHQLEPADLIPDTQPGGALLVLEDTTVWDGYVAGRNVARDQNG